MNKPCLKFEDPIQDAISRIRFAPTSNNLLISSWDSNLRLYDVDKAVLRLQVPGEAALLDCCFEDDAFCLTSACDGFVTRYDVHSETKQLLGRHDDLATCVECSIETGQILSAGWDRKILSWDPRITYAIRPPIYVDAEVEAMSISSTNLMIAVGKYVLVYDLRYFDQPVQAKESRMDFHIRCLRSFSDSKGFAAGSTDGRLALETVQSSELLDKGYDSWHKLLWNVTGDSYYNNLSRSIAPKVLFYGYNLTKCLIYISVGALQSTHQPDIRVDGNINRVTPLSPDRFNYYDGDTKYAFRCYPKSGDGKKYLCAVNDISFHPGAFGTFVTGSNDGHVIVWNAQSKKRQFELPSYPNSVAGVSYNFDGQLLAVASSHTYQEAKEKEEEPKIFVHAMHEDFIASMSAGNSAKK